MEAFSIYRNTLVNKNREQFSDYPEINWLNPYKAAEFQVLRNKLTENLGENWLFKETKPYHRQISKGCLLCGTGTWSCLFITGKCNASCFYCPASQQKDEVPSTQSFSFEAPEAYAEYINFFSFKGVSFSGGEPLLFFDRTLQYLKQIRKRCTPEIYTWMYTNGILAEESKFRKLASNGLNEVRFDIGATGFRLDKIKFAQGIVPNITIEIPAIPEEKERLKKVLPEMIKVGVTNLNLHQLRLTKHNAQKLLQRNYTFVSAEQPVVLESELAALEILNYANEHHLDIGVNYCSFWFKNRFQNAGFRRQVTNALAEPNEIITEKGFIRKYNGNKIAYKTLQISENGINTEYGTELKIRDKTYYIKQATAMNSIILDEKTRQEAENLFQKGLAEIPADSPLFDIWNMEYIERGLREY